MKNECGQGMIEYGLIFALIALAAIMGLNIAGISTREAYCTVLKSIGVDACKKSLFSDDFEDLDEWEIIYGNWRIEDGKACIDRGGLMFTDIPDSDNYQITLSGAEMTRGNGYGLMFRANNFERDNSYIFQYDPGYRGGAMIYRERANRREFRPSAQYYPGAGYSWKNQPRTIRIVVEGDLFTTYVDGEQVLQTRDSTWEEGGIGLRSWDNTSACFDSITVDPLP